MSRIINNKKFLISIVVTFILTVGLWRICPLMFQNNDDKFLLYMMAGYTTGSPAMTTIFGGFLWAGIVCLFYKIYAGLTWYTVLTLVVLIISVATMCRSFIVTESKRDLVTGLLAFVLVFVSVLAYFMSAIQYTVTAAYMGAAAVCALIIAGRMSDKRYRIAYEVLSVVLIVLSFSIRKQMGLVTMSAVGITLFFMIFSEQRRYAIKMLIIACGFFVIVYASNAIYEKATGLDEFNEYYDVVQRWIDYPHLDIAEDTDGVYASVGWDDELYAAAEEWFFMDDRVNTESIQTINEATAEIQLTTDEIITRALDAITNKQMVNIQVIMWLIVVVLANVIAISKKSNLAQVLGVDAMFVLFLLVVFYFCFMQGRFPLRVYQALVIIYFVPTVAILIGMLRDSKLYTVVPWLIGVGIILIAVTYKVYPAGSMLYQLKLATHDSDRQEMISQVTELEEYASAHTDHVYIYDYELSQPSDIFVNFGENMPYNILFWGGWTYNSPVYYQQLAANGLESISSEDLVDGDIYLCGTYVDETIQAYMESQFGDIEVEIVDQVDDILIYRYVSK